MRQSQRDLAALSPWLQGGGGMQRRAAHFCGGHTKVAVLLLCALPICLVALLASRAPTASHTAENSDGGDAEAPRRSADGGEIGDAGPFDAIIVPAGGQSKEGPPEHVRLRLEKAVDVYMRQEGQKPIVITTARGTPHKPSPLSEAGFEVHEAEMNARFLLDHGVLASDIVEESASLETVGNAYFARVLHTDLLGVRRIAVINNKWHMPRTRAVFEHVFAVPPDKGYSLTFITVDDGLPPDVVATRLKKEAEALPKFSEGGEWRGQTRTLQELHRWVNFENTAYAVKRLAEARKPIDPALAASY